MGSQVKVIGNRKITRDFLLELHSNDAPYMYLAPFIY